MFEKLQPGIVAIIAAQTDQIPDRYDTTFLEWLDVEENLRLRRFHFERDRRRFLLAHGLSRWTLGRCLNEHPAAVRIGRHRYGKPYVRHTGRLAFSLSHTSRAILCAVAYAERIGADIESRKRANPVHELIPACCTFSERRLLSTVPGEAAAATFLRWWTIKEAYIKADGRGLGIHPRTICCARSVTGEDNRLEVACEVNRNDADIICQGGVARAWSDHSVAWVVFASRAGLQPVYLYWLGGDDLFPLPVDDEWHFSGITDIHDKL
jgi:phosphopantetheinyl transferase